LEDTNRYGEAILKLAKFLKEPESDSVIFTRNTTEAMNLIAYSWGMNNLKENDEIIIDYAEHHANIIPWHFVSQKTGAVVKAIKLTKEQRLDLNHFETLLSNKTKVVSVAHMSNVLGVIHPIKQLAQKAHEVGAIMIADGAQAAPHVPVDVQALEVDFYTLSGHKMCGPTGAGAVWGKAELLRSMPPFLGGGEMIRKVTIEGSSYADIPNRFEAGTPNISEVIALGAAVDYLETIGMQAIMEHDQHLTRYALEKLKKLDGIELYGPEGSDRGGIIPFNITGVHPHDVATALDQELSLIHI